VPKLSSIAPLMLALLVSGCGATQYKPQGFLNGYGSQVLELESGIWRVTFRANPHTTNETVQAYWLYRSAELALEKGFDGFEILTPIQFVRLDSRTEAEVHLAAGPVFIPMFTSPRYQDPEMEGDIRLLKGPIRHAPPRVFDAAQLKVALEPYVRGDKCDAGNVCPHVHRYLHRAVTTS